MRKLTLLAVCLFTSTSLCLAQAKKQPTKKAVKTTKPVAQKAPQKELSPEEEMKIWMEYGTPSEVHKMLAQGDGHWNSQITQWMKPDTEPMKSEGSCENKMIMGGRYQMSNFMGNFMGMPFEGMSIVGYDNATQEFTSTWIDNMGTGVMTMKGKWDEGTKTINFTGKMVNPCTKSEINVKETFTIKDENTHIMKMYMDRPDGKGEFQTMEIVFTRG